MWCNSTSNTKWWPAKTYLLYFLSVNTLAAFFVVFFSGLNLITMSTRSHIIDSTIPSLFSVPHSERKMLVLNSCISLQLFINVIVPQEYHRPRKRSIHKNEHRSSMAHCDPTMLPDDGYWVTSFSDLENSMAAGKYWTDALFFILAFI